MPLLTLASETNLEKLHAINTSYGWRKKLSWQKVRHAGLRLLVNTYNFNANAVKCVRCGSMVGDLNLSYFILMSTGVVYGCAKCGFVEGPMPTSPRNKPHQYFAYIDSAKLDQQVDPYEAIEIMRRNKQDPSFGGMAKFYEETLRIHLPRWPLY